MACTLSTSDLRDRVAWIDALLGRELVEVTAVVGGVRARFRACAETESELEALVKLEAECCPLLTITLLRDDDGLMLEITGPPDARALIEQLWTRSRAGRDAEC